MLNYERALFTVLGMSAIFNGCQKGVCKFSLVSVHEADTMSLSTYMFQTVTDCSIVLEGVISVKKKKKNSEKKKQKKYILKY